MVQKITDEAFEYYSNPTNTTIRLATTLDAFRIAEIHILGWRFAYKGIISEEILNNLSIERSMTARRNGILDGSEEIYVIEKDKVIYGHLTIGKCRDADKNESTFELWGVYIHPDFLRNGYGHQFLKFCELQARQRGHKEVVLWVLKDNKIGRSFYEKNGYSHDSTEKFLEKLSATEIRYSKFL
jgi:GNAT superfamily N-acetyltransferase